MQNRMRWLPVWVALVLFLGILAGCGVQSDVANPSPTPDATPAETPEAAQTPEAQSDFPVEVTDYHGNVVTVTEKPATIISLAPAVTEVLYALGAGDRVIGVTALCDYPPEAAEVDKVGDFEGPNVELVLEKNPDLVISGGYMHEEATETLTDAGITVLPVEAESFANVYASIENIGLATGRAEPAAAIIADMEAGVATVQGQVAEFEPVRVFYMMSYGEELWTGSEGTFIHDMIGYAGGVNIAAEAETPWTRYSMEAIVEGDPEVIVCDVYVDTEAVKADPALQSISAVVNDRVYMVSDSNIFSRGGPRLIQGLQELAGMLHPDLRSCQPTE